LPHAVQQAQAQGCGDPCINFLGAAQAQEKRYFFAYRVIRILRRPSTKVPQFTFNSFHLLSFFLHKTAYNQLTSITIMASEQIRAPGSKPGENMLWGGRFTG
jgi:hypothetical protein